MNKADQQNTFDRKLSNIITAVRRKEVCKALQWRLTKIGLKIEAFYLQKESMTNAPEQQPQVKLADYEVALMSAEDMAEVAKLEYSYEKETLHKKLSMSHKCLGIKHNGRIVAVLWWDPHECHDARYRFALGSNEAYFYASSTTPAYKGKGLAPYLRYMAYRQLEREGKDTFYSIIDYDNKPSLRVTEKLNAENLKLNLYVSILNKFKHKWVIRDYCPDFKR